MSTQTPTTLGWQPPPDYIPMQSNRAGISVYAPAPQTPDLSDKKVSYKCPQCGATTRFDVQAGGVVCEHCGYSVAPKAKTVGKKAEEFEFTLETLEQCEHGWGIDRQELHCDSCGANISLGQGALTATCPFCASNKVNLHKAPSDVLRPRFLVPFRIQMEQVRQSASQWLGQGWFHPSELASNVVIDRFNGVYLPYWTFDATIKSRWKAEVGYERQESYYDHQSKEWKNRTVIDWRWEDGDVKLEIDDLLVTGSSKASRILLERLKSFNLNGLVTYSPDYLAGWQAQAYDVNLPAAWEEGKATMRETARQACRDSIRSSHVRNFSMTADFADELWRYVLLPVYIAAYRFEDKAYQVMVNGQTGAVAGQKPVAWWKIWLAMAALLGPGLLLGLVGLPLLLAGGFGIVPIGLGAVLLAIGGFISFMIYQKAVESEAA